MKYAIALALMATPLAAQTLDGTYHWSGTDPVAGCDLDTYNDGRITLADDKITFVESTCTLTNPTAIRDMAEGTLFDMVCSGEGEEWTERVFIYQTFDGVAVLSRGAARTYQRCE
ncbi:hypothetical protein [Pseudooctadecabacter sp.]|uniref:hypothetical protein n=1 Tax=Pseudooctadecabacter sp. TaxID=1966338 RepID=UPI0025EEFEEA|nr:hypothetical protein [Pseudooctadecabacter sp.]